MESEKFEYGGLNEYQKKSIKTICFQTSRVSFVPKESLKTFGELDGIAIIDTDLRILEFDWLENFLKYVKKAVKNLYFHENQIEMIEPKVLSIFARMNRVFLRGNPCIKEGFPISRDPSIMKLELRSCIENYENSRGALQLLPMVNKTLSARMNEIEKQMKKQRDNFNDRLGKIEKTLDRIIKKIDNLNIIELYCSHCNKNETKP